MSANGLWCDFCRQNVRNARWVCNSSWGSGISLCEVCVAQAAQLLEIGYVPDPLKVPEIERAQKEVAQISKELAQYKSVNSVLFDERERLRNELADARVDISKANKSRSEFERKCKALKKHEDIRHVRKLYVRVLDKARKLKREELSLKRIVAGLRYDQISEMNRLDEIMQRAVEMPQPPVAAITISMQNSSDFTRSRRSSGPIPRKSGIYFVWVESKVAYVGQSTNLEKRLTSYHDKIKDGDLGSWLEFPVPELNFAESYYIWRCRPPRNFGMRSCRQSESA